jgi:uncharacterized membrane protein YbhN (UPF0104 family)
VHRIFDFIKKHKKAITNIMTILVLVLMAYYLYKNRGVFVSLENLELQYIVYIFLLQIVSIFLIALTNKKVISLLDHEIPLKEAFLLQYANSFLNKVVSEGGALFRGIFLKEIYKLPYTKYISTIAGLYVVSFITNSLIGIISLTYIYLLHRRISYLVLFFFLIVIVCMLILLFIDPHFNNKKDRRVINWLNSILEGWNRIKRDKAKLVIFVFLSICSLVLVSFQAVLVYKGLGFQLGLFESLYMTSLGMITTFVNITPDSIGIKEAVYVFTSDVVGLNSDIILLGSLIIRAIGLINTFLIGGIAYLKLSPRLKGVKRD